MAPDRGEQTPTQQFVRRELGKSTGMWLLDQWEANTANIVRIDANPKNVGARIRQKEKEMLGRGNRMANYPAFQVPVDKCRGNRRVSQRPPPA